MTKLTEWLVGGTIFLGIWLAVVTNNTPIKITEEIQLWAYMIPFFVLTAFGFVSLGIIAYRVATFNNCDEAYRELVKVYFIVQKLTFILVYELISFILLIKEIEEAKQDLTSKGFKSD